ncbi:hypothetical protein QYF61_022338 [Mycteria americana]|uniref:Uncharacterized protein n=1 Tax=Mycteria americana TaxID=33587 RepID=A0AAN7N6L2_MYCAM|nr:hypothetical protein QYF61_022338 [Mycteria americana]
MGRPGRSIISHSHKPAKASAMCLQWWKQPLAGWKHILCPMPPPGTLSWALKSKSYSNMATQKELRDFCQSQGGSVMSSGDTATPDYLPEKRFFASLR